MMLNYFELSAFPNPFNALTAISFQLPAASYVSLRIFDVTGRSVGAIHESPLPHNQYLSAGSHSVVFDAKDLSSGVYFVRLEAGELSQARKILLVK